MCLGSIVLKLAFNVRETKYLILTYTRRVAIKDHYRLHVGI